MHGGRILQIGAPNEIYDRPETAFVATFLGTSNLFTGPVSGEGTAIDAPEGRIALPRHAGRSEATLSVRPERVALGPETEAMQTRLQGRVMAASFRGSYAAYRIALVNGSGEVTVYRQADAALGDRGIAVGETLDIGWRAEDSVIVVGDTA